MTSSREDFTPHVMATDAIGKRGGRVVEAMGMADARGSNNVEQFSDGRDCLVGDYELMVSCG